MKRGGREKKNTMVQRSLETLSHRRCLSSLVEKELSSFLVLPFFNSCLLVHTHTYTRIRIRGGFIRICFLFFCCCCLIGESKKKTAKKNQESKNRKARGKLKKKIINNNQTKTCLCSLSLRPPPPTTQATHIYIYIYIGAAIKTQVEPQPQQQQQHEGGGLKTNRGVLAGQPTHTHKKRQDSLFFPYLFHLPLSTSRRTSGVLSIVRLKQ